VNGDRIERVLIELLLNGFGVAKEMAKGDVTEN
jgi:hypothetical protein